MKQRIKGLLVKVSDLGDKVGVDEAKDQGIISQVLEPENLLQYALKVAENLTMLPQV